MPDRSIPPHKLLLEMAEAKAAEGLGGQALRYADLSIQASGTVPGAHYLKARLLAAAGRKEEAAASLSRALRLDPGQDQALRLQKILADHPDWRPRIASVPEILKAAQAAYGARDFKAMTAGLLNLIAALGPEPNTQLLNAWCMLGYYKEACETMRSLTSERAGRRRADLLGLTSSWDLVWTMPAAYYEWHFRGLNAARLSPELKPYLLFLRYTLSIPLTGKKHGTVAGLEKLIAAYPRQLSFARISAAIRSLSSGDLPKAVACCRKLIKDGYDVWLVHCLLGEALLCGGASAAGFKEFGRAAAADKEKAAEIRAWEAELRLFMKQYARAEKLLIGNDSRHARCWLGAARLELGKRGLAVKDLEAAAASCPEDVEAKLWLAEARRRGGDKAGALRLFREIAAAEPGNFWALAGMAATLPDKAERLACFRRAEKAWPELARAAGGARAGVKDPARALLRLQELCGGFRRTDRYLLSLVLGRQTP